MPGSVSDSEPRNGEEAVSVSIPSQAMDDVVVFTGEASYFPRAKTTARWVLARLCTAFFGLFLLFSIPLSVALGTVVDEDFYYNWLEDMDLQEFDAMKHSLFFDYQDAIFAENIRSGRAAWNALIDFAASSLSPEIARALLEDNLPGLLSYLRWETDTAPYLTARNVAVQWSRAMNERLSSSVLPDRVNEYFFSVGIEPQEIEAQLTGVRRGMRTAMDFRTLAIALCCFLPAAAFFLHPSRRTAIRALALSMIIVSMLVLTVPLVLGATQILDGEFFLSALIQFARRLIVPSLFCLVLGIAGFLTTAFIFPRRRA